MYIYTNGWVLKQPNCRFDSILSIYVRISDYLGSLIIKQNHKKHYTSTTLYLNVRIYKCVKKTLPYAKPKNNQKLHNTHTNTHHYTANTHNTKQYNL